MLDCIRSWAKDRQGWLYISMLYEASRGGEEGKRQLKRDAVVQRHSTVLQNINKGTYEKPLIQSLS